MNKPLVFCLLIWLVIYHAASRGEHLWTVSHSVDTVITKTVSLPTTVNQGKHVSDILQTSVADDQQTDFTTRFDSIDSVVRHHEHSSVFQSDWNIREVSSQTSVQFTDSSDVLEPSADEFSMELSQKTCISPSSSTECISPTSPGLKEMTATGVYSLEYAIQSTGSIEQADSIEDVAATRSYSLEYAIQSTFSVEHPHNRHVAATSLYFNNGIESTMTIEETVAKGPLSASLNSVLNSSQSWSHFQTQLDTASRQLQDSEEQTSAVFSSSLPMSASTHSTPGEPASCSIFCEMSTGLFMINTSVCDSVSSFKIIPTYAPSTVNFWINPEHTSPLYCDWMIVVPKQHSLLLTFDQVASDEGRVDITLTDKRHELTNLDLSDFRRERVTQTWHSNLTMKYWNFRPDSTVPLTFHYVIVQNVLPSVQLTYTTGYVTSPEFNTDGTYPADYDGTFDINVPDNYSVITKFINFHIEQSNTAPTCQNDYAMMSELRKDNTTGSIIWKKCGSGDIPFQIFRSSIQLRFVSNSHIEMPGFKMIYTILPTHQEPELTSGNMYDCSVPYFEQFSFVFRCNFVQDCEGGEDEENCDYKFTRLNGCNDVLCQTGPGFFVITTTTCNTLTKIDLNASTEHTTAVVMVDPQTYKTNINCKWNIHVPDKHHLLLTFDQLASDLGDTFEIYVWNISRFIVYSGHHNMRSLQKRNVTVQSLVMCKVSFFNWKPHISAAVTFHFHAEPNILPSGKLSETTGFVTSPNFHINHKYPRYYDGTYDINISANFSVLMKITYMSVQDATRCRSDFLTVYAISQENETDKMASKLCGKSPTVPFQNFSSSARIRFKSSGYSTGTGFKIVYAIMPSRLLPTVSTSNLFNCSVPHFNLFKLVIQCDLIVECQEMEDETGCEYSGRSCGPAALDVGAKCYTVVKPKTSVTWYSASVECNNRQQQLVTPATLGFRNRIKNITFTFDISDFFVGLQLNTPTIAAPASALYKHVWQWVDGRSAFTVSVSKWQYEENMFFPMCAQYIYSTDKILSIDCFKPSAVSILCEFDNPAVKSTPPAIRDIMSREERNFTFKNLSMVLCPLGHVTKNFLSCDPQSQCGAEVSPCPTAPNQMQHFTCDNEEHIPYTLVCDHISQCGDGSDEDFCFFKACTHDLFECQNQQCIGIDSVCNGKLDCFDESDEICHLEIRKDINTIDPPTVVDIDGFGKYKMIHTSDCPATHFWCADRYCLPVFLLCNGIADCVGGEDEAECDSYTCPGFYRCRGSTVCLHPHYVCDGVFHCPQYDDEQLCQEPSCPEVCFCQGLAFVCNDTFSVTSFPDLRYLDISYTGLSTDFISLSWYLVTARLTHNRMTQVSTLALYNLRNIDLSYNQIITLTLQSFGNLKNLRSLRLKGNPLRIIFNSGLEKRNGTYSQRLTGTVNKGLQQMRVIDLSFSEVEVYNQNVFTSYPLIQLLNLSHSKLHTITEAGFRSTPKLEILDLRTSFLKNFPSDLLKNLSHLKTVHANNFILCCEAMLPPGFDSTQCYAEQDLLTSCEDLLRSNTYRVFLWIFASFSLVGNVGSFIGRMYLTKEDKKLGSFSIFVSNLCLADLLMGVYLTIIGVADQVYRGVYLWHSEQWRNSITCSLAGFLSLMSSEVSAFMICLITLDRFLVLAFPFSVLHFNKRSALVACAIVWILGILLAAIPLMPVTSHWQFYSQTGICIPLPFTPSDKFKGHTYSLAVMIVINFVVFMLIAVGQAIIYWSVRRNSMAPCKDSTSRHATIARRLTAIVISDFLCWFPIGLLGLLASTGTPIPGEINVGVAILVLPFNSALNPFLYTFNILLEKHQKGVEERLLQRMEARHTSDNTPKSPTSKTTCNNCGSSIEQ